MLIRSDLLRRYPNATIYATRAVATPSGRGPSSDPAEEVLPAFRGSMPPDVCFFGFHLSVEQVVGSATDPGHYVVIQEHAGEPRFGLDAGAMPDGASRLDATAAVPPGLATNGLEWGRNSAHMAGILRRRPVRIAVHASQLIGQG